MEIRELLNKALSRNLSDYSALSDAFEAVRLIEKEDFKLAHEKNKIIRQFSARYARENADVKMFELNKKSLLFDAPYDLDAYLQYLEWDREPKDRFYLPRRRIMKRVADAMQRLVDGELDELFLSMPPRVGKLLADSTPVLTTNGWKKHGELQVGDYVFSPEGKPIKVIAVHPKYHTTHTVTMTDGSKFKCHFRHEWKVIDRRFGRTRILETQDLIGHLENGKKFGRSRGHRYNFMIETKDYLRGIPVNLPVFPYTLGAWLGDGSNKQPRIHGSEDDQLIVERIKKDGYSISHKYIHKKTGVVTTVFSGLRQDLKKIGMCYSRRRIGKYIPDIYLIAPIKDRLELLAGLLDTDGTLRKKEGRYDFTTSEVKLKNDVISLVSTFGWRVSVKEVMPHKSSSGIQGKSVYWVISFNPTMHIPCVLERKKLYEFKKQRRLAIASIEESEPEQGNCITVEGGMYLAGERLIPTHNTTMLMLFMTWLVGRDSERSNLYSAYSDVITSAFYNGCLEIINDPATYLWHDVFPAARIVSTNAKDETFNVDRKKRYPSLTCRSLYGTLNGACDCNGMLVSDDLIGGIEEALNKDRLMSAWSKVDNNLLPRAKETAKILWCGTRWSMIDPAGIRMDLLLNDPAFQGRRYEIINLPALDAQENSNFNYLYGVGFSDEYYIQRRASFERNNDMASWLAQYMGEPIERSGALFEPQDMRFYNGVLPDDPVRVFMAVDPAFGGGDFTASPVCYQYADGSIYVADVVYSDGDKRITQPMIVNKVLEHGVKAVQIEANKSTASYKDEVENLLRKQGVRVNITTKTAPSNVSKEMRIFDKAPEIRELYFLEEGKRSKEYSQFMQNVYSFKLTGKNKHDDSVDSLAQAVEMAISTSGIVSVKKRMF